MLLLDEPTAHLDRESATAVSRAIAALRGKVTVLLVAHDRLTRELADEIVAVAPGAALQVRAWSRVRLREASAAVASARRGTVPLAGSADAAAVRAGSPDSEPLRCLSPGRWPTSRRRRTRRAPGFHGTPGSAGCSHPSEPSSPRPAPSAPWRRSSPSPSPGSPAG